MTSKRLNMLVGLAIAGAIGVVWGTALASGANPPTDSGARAAVSPRLRVHFALFRRARIADFGAVMSAAPPIVERALGIEASPASVAPSGAAKENIPVAANVFIAVVSATSVTLVSQRPRGVSIPAGTHCDLIPRASAVAALAT